METKTQNPVKQMAWLPASHSPNAEKILHLKFMPGDPWRVYSATQWAEPDTNFKTPNGMASKGFRTSQILLQKGWVYVSTEEASFHLQSAPKKSLEQVH